MATQTRTGDREAELLRRVKKTKEDNFTEALNSIAKAQKENLDELDLSGLSLAVLPESLWELISLRKLNLSYNQLTSVPESLGQLTALQSLHLSNNQLTSVPESLGQLTALQTLNLFANQLTSVPESIGQLTALRELDLSNNRLTSVPESIGQLTALLELNLSSNQLTSMPATLGQLTALQELNLFSNQLTSVPATLEQLTALQALFLPNNQLTSVPATFGQLTALQILDLSNNQLRSVPATLGQLTALQWLYLSNNQLTSVQESLGQLTVLHELDLSDNQLPAVPEGLRKCRNLRGLYLHGNAKLDIPDEILGPRWVDATLKKATPAKALDILEYYFRTRGGKKPLNEAKLILVGRGAVGKTSLVNRLVHKKFSPKEKKTEGIKISNWQLILRKGKVKLNTWDFGGQEIMHATHQFFLTQRSLYLLVLNGREGGEDADAEYWLKLIEAFGGNSPVIVVLNKIKEHPFDLNRSALQQKYPSIKEFVKTDCKSASGIKELKKIIERETNKLENLRASFPAAWFDIKKKLPEIKRDFLSFEEFRAFCSKNGEADEQAQDQLAVFLHELGIALNYKDDPRLNDTHVLNPHWVTTGIYKILNSKKLEEQKGEIRLQDLSKVLDSKTYPPRMRAFLLDLMKKFELCFKFPDKDECYLIPELLPKQEPKEARGFDPKQCLNFQYHYPVLPEGLLPRFIVRTHILSEELPRWRTGVVLEFEGSKALVKADPQEKKVFISVSGDGEGKRRLMGLIRSDFEKIHSDIKNLQPQEIVPLPNYPDATIPHHDLVVMSREGRTRIERVVGNSVVDVNVTELAASVDVDKTFVTRVQTKMTPEFPSGEFSRRLLRLFISYSHKDERFRERLDVYLKILQRSGKIEVWHDRKLTAGDEWKKKIDENLERADLTLFLVSVDFIASDYCTEVEAKRALERHQSGETRIIPVILRDVDWSKMAFAEFQALPKDGKPIKKWPDRDSAWRNVSEGIEKAIEELSGAQWIK